MHNAKRTQGIETDQLCSLKKTTCQCHLSEKGFNLLGSIKHKDWTLLQWKKVMWSD